MKINDAIIGIFVILFAAILFGDAILTTLNPANMLLSPNDVKGITGMIALLLAIYIFLKARE